MLGFNEHGEIKLETDQETPEHKNISWFSMLFAAGMGIGLVFFGVAEPLMHYLNPPVGDALTIAAQKLALNITCLFYSSPSPRDCTRPRIQSSA